MNTWTVRTRLIAAFATIIAIMLALGVVTYVRLVGIRSEAQRLDTDALPGILLSGETSTLAKEILPAVLARSVASDAAGRQRAAATVERVLTDLARIEQEHALTAKNSAERRLFGALDLAQSHFTESYRLSTADDAITLTELDATLRPALDRLVAVSDSLLALNRANGQAAAASILRAVSASLAVLVVAVALAAVVAMVCAWLLVRLIQDGLSRLMSVTRVMSAGDFRQRAAIPRPDEMGMLGAGINQMADDLTALIGRVQQSGIQVNSSATEIAATSKQQQATATEIAATTSEVGATALRISATSKELVRTMDAVVQVADQTSALAEGGQGGLQRMEGSMRQIGEASALINARLALLSEKAANIGLVVTTINKVADQTNLLSLNAAIEAEKAGEHGRGFTVVAREIRRLADQTAGATFDIEQLVKEMQSAVSAGVMGMDKFSEEVRRGGEVIDQVTAQLSAIIEQVQTLTPSFEAVNEGVKSQSISAEQIAEALSQLSVAAQQTADSLRQSNVAIEQLNDAARGLQDGVSRFTLAG